MSSSAAAMCTGSINCRKESNAAKTKTLSLAACGVGKPTRAARRNGRSSDRARSLNRHRNLGTKFQTPISKQIPITNLQNRNKRLTLVYWDLELPWDLVLEIWDF